MNKYFLVICFWNMFLFIILSSIQMDNIINCFVTYNHCVWICEISNMFILWSISALMKLIYGFFSVVEISRTILK